MKSIALGNNEQTMVDRIIPRIEHFSLPPRPSTVMSDRASLTKGNLRRLSAQASSPARTSHSSGRRHSTQPFQRASPHQVSPNSRPVSRPVSRADSRVSPHSGRRASPQSALFLNASPGLDELSEIETVSEVESSFSGLCDSDERALLSRTAVIETMRNIQGRLEAALRTAGQLDEDELRSYDVGNAGRPAHSRLSTESHDSKMIPLQRGRRKPTLNGDEIALMTPSPLGSAELGFEQERSGTSRTSGGVSLMRQRMDARTSAVSLLKPGTSIFGDRPGGLGRSNSTDSQSNWHSKSPIDPSPLETVLDDDNEMDDLTDTFGIGKRVLTQQQRRSRRLGGMEAEEEAEDEERRSIRSQSSISDESGEEDQEGERQRRRKIHRASVASVYEEAREEVDGLASVEEEEGDEESLEKRESRTRRKAISRVSMIGLPSHPEGLGLQFKSSKDFPHYHQQQHEIVTPRTSFMSHDSGSTVKLQTTVPLQHSLPPRSLPVRRRR